MALTNGWQSATLRYSVPRRSRKQIVLVLLLVLDCPISDYEKKDDDEDERFARLQRFRQILIEYNSVRYEAALNRYGRRPEQPTRPA